MHLDKICKKGKHMNSWESMYIQEYKRKDLLVSEQKPFEHNSLFDIIQTTTPPHDNYGLLHA